MKDGFLKIYIYIERENDIEVKIVAANIFTVGTDFKAHNLFIRHFRPVCMFPIQTISHGSLQTDVGTIWQLHWHPEH